MKDKYNLLIKDTIIFAIGSLGSKAILFFLVPLYTNILTTNEYGTADLVSTMASLLVPISSLVINSSVIRFGMMNGEKPEDVLVTSYAVLGASSIILLTTFPLYGFYKPISEWRFYLIAQVILTNLSEVGRTYLKVKGENKLFSAISILQTAVLACSNVVLLSFCKQGVAGYLSANILATASATVASFFIGRTYKDLRKGRIDLFLMKRMVAYSAPLILSNVSWWAVHSSDKIMIEWVLGSSMLGVYTAATKIPSLINVMIAIFNQAWGISSIREVESSGESTFYSKVFGVFSTLLFGVCIMLVMCIKPFMDVYIGSAFSDAWKYTPLLLVAAVFYSFTAFVGGLYAALKKTNNDMWTTVLCAVINVVVNCIAIKNIGLWGAALGTLAAYFSSATIRLFDIRHYINLEIKKSYSANCLLIVIHAVAVSFGWHPTEFSVLAIVLFVLINHVELGEMLSYSRIVIKGVMGGKTTV